MSSLTLMIIDSIRVWKIIIKKNVVILETSMADREEIIQ